MIKYFPDHSNIKIARTKNKTLPKAIQSIRDACVINFYFCFLLLLQMLFEKQNLRDLIISIFIIINQDEIFSMKIEFNCL